jgi:hypothetical protein
MELETVRIFAAPGCGVPGVGSKKGASMEKDEWMREMRKVLQIPEQGPVNKEDADYLDAAAAWRKWDELNPAEDNGQRPVAAAPDAPPVRSRGGAVSAHNNATSRACSAGARVHAIGRSREHVGPGRGPAPPFWAKVPTQKKASGCRTNHRPDCRGPGADHGPTGAGHGSDGHTR